MLILYRVLRIIADEGVLGLVRRVGDRLRHSKLAFGLYKLGLIGHDAVYGRQYYEDMDRESAIRDATRFATLVLAKYEIDSVIELGCGTGRLLYPYYEAGIEVHGVDLSRVAKKVSRLPSSRFEIYDLQEPYTPSRSYDLGLCVEVLEHIPAESVNTIVASVCRCSDRVIISAARPGQGGTHHVNEQPVEYWIDKFEATGMTLDDDASAYFNSRLALDDLKWIPGSLLVFEDVGE